MLDFLPEREDLVKREWMPDFLTVLCTKSYNYILTLSQTRADRKFNLIMYLSFPDYYPFSVMWSLKQCW